MSDTQEVVTLREYMDKIFALNNAALEKAFSLNNAALEKAFSLNSVAINKTEEITNTKLEAITKDIDALTKFQDRFFGMMGAVTILNGVITAMVVMLLRK